MILRGSPKPELLQNEVLADILHHTASRHPSHIALIDGIDQSEISYAQLDQTADLIAHHLIRLGVKPGQIVGLWLPRGRDLLLMQAGIAKAGAAWLPFDAEVPVDRIQVCLGDAQAVGLVTAPSLTAQLTELDVPVWTADTLTVAVDGSLQQQRALPEHPAYVIYTSGSTGKPKGIMINQRSICHFLRSENAILGIRDSDIVYQGFSVAFDMSFEEIWISYLVGAALWIAPKEVTNDPEAIVQAIEDHEIDVLHTVPTLLALLPRDIPNLRLINLGGEMCPESLVERWCLPHRQVFNSYGPTETTVSASLTQLQQGQPVTIGEPLPNYGMLVLGEQGELLDVGATGELCIFGPGVSDGYLGRDDLTAEKFITNPYSSAPNEARLYRTGDLAKIDLNGQVHCLGRSDDQVKIRGFRVELGEIEAKLCAQDGVGTAAVIVQNRDGIDQLLAFVVMDEGVRFDSPALRQALQAKLPPYMVPNQIIDLPEMPRLASGKIDRKTLAKLEMPSIGVQESDTPSTPAEEIVFEALHQVFPKQAVHLTSDFFYDLGGHSLLAARTVSLLRHHPALGTFGVQAIYQGRTPQQIALAVEPLLNKTTAATQKAVEPALSPDTLRRRFICGIAQAATLPFLICFRMLQWLLPFFAYHYLTGDDDSSLLQAIGWVVVVYLLTQIGSFCVVALVKRLIFHRVPAGRYRLWGITYFRWWLFERLSEITPNYLISNSPIYIRYLQLLGANIGRDCTLGSVVVRVPHLLTIGEESDISNGVNIENAQIEGEYLVLGQVNVGARAYVGSYSVLMGDTTIETHGYLEGLSVLDAGQTLTADTVWQGSPAMNIRPRLHNYARPDEHNHAIRAEFLPYFLGALLIATLFLLPIFPGFILLDYFDDRWGLSDAARLEWDNVVAMSLIGIPASAILLVITLLFSIVLRRVVLPKNLLAGRYSIYSWLYYKKWLVNQIQEAGLVVLHGLYASIYSATWFRMLGARIGRDVEISTAMGVVPDLLTMGDDSFVADGVMLGDEHVESGWMTLRPTIIGNNSFLGNGSYVPDGRVVPDGVLIGVQTHCPPTSELSSGQTWIGTPAINLPQREKPANIDPKLTFRPSFWRRLARGTVELLRMIIPSAIVISAGYFTILEVVIYTDQEQWLMSLSMLALCGIIFGLVTFVFIFLSKWLLIRRYRPLQVPMWTPFVWTSEAMTSMYESVVVPNFMNFLRGTPMLPWAFRLLGVKIGKNVFMDTTDITEYDCVTIGDHCILNAHCGPQTHLFEDRIMKIGRVNIGSQVSVASRSTILYDTEIGDGVYIGPLTLILKGEFLPANTRWAGSPAHSIDE